MTEPRTEAGKRLLASKVLSDRVTPELRQTILDIEAEAAAPALAEVRRLAEVHNLTLAAMDAAEAALPPPAPDYGTVRDWNGKPSTPSPLPAETPFSIPALPVPALDTLRAMSEAATPGPWQPYIAYSGESGTPDEVGIYAGAGTTHHGFENTVIADFSLYAGDALPDLEFIAAAVNYIRAALGGGQP